MKRLALVAILLASPLTLHAENWPGFRGPTRQGISSETNLPTKWSATENVAWKAEIPGTGWSSPIVWGDQVFLTTATDEGKTLRLLCLDRRTGKTLWDKAVCQQKLTRKEGKNSYATPTPVTDGQRVYVVSFNGGIFAVTMDGSIAWANRDVAYSSRHGLGVSPILYQDMVVVPFDGSSSGPDEYVGWQKPWDQAVILAVDKNTGKTRWKGTRGLSRIAHITPTILRVEGKDQLISAAGDVIQGFDLSTGERIWSATSRGEGVVPSVVIGDGLVYTASGFGKPAIRAVRPGGKGDVTATQIAWEQSKAVPTMSSFLYVKPYLYTINEQGIALCLQGDTGKIVWQERIGGNHCASPIFADGKIYFLSEEGETTIIEAGPKFKVVTKNNLQEKCQASCAVSQGQIFLRTEKNLYCLGKKP